MQYCDATQMVAIASQDEGRGPPPRPTAAPTVNTRCMVPGCSIEVGLGCALGCGHFVCKEHQLIAFVENQPSFTDAAKFYSIGSNRAGSPVNSTLHLQLAEVCPRKCILSTETSIPRMPACPPAVLEFIKWEGVKTNIAEARDERHNVARELNLTRLVGIIPEYTREEARTGYRPYDLDQNTMVAYDADVVQPRDASTPIRTQDLVLLRLVSNRGESPVAIFVWAERSQRVRVVMEAFMRAKYGVFIQGRMNSDMYYFQKAGPLGRDSPISEVLKHCDTIRVNEDF